MWEKRMPCVPIYECLDGNFLEKLSNYPGNVTKTFNLSFNNLPGNLWCAPSPYWPAGCFLQHTLKPWQPHTVPPHLTPWQPDPKWPLPLPHTAGWWPQVWARMHGHLTEGEREQVSFHPLENSVWYSESRRFGLPKYPITAAPMVRAGPLRWPAALWISFTGVAFSWEDTASWRRWKRNDRN